jgi:hypothetical protein
VKLGEGETAADVLAAGLAFAPDFPPLLELAERR